DARIYNRALSSAEIQSVYSGSSVGGPVLTQQPSSQLAPSGANLTLTASATGASPLSYQWYYNSVALAGKTNASLSLLAVTVGQSGTYSITVSNSLGTATSAPAEIVILNAPAITTQPQSQLGGVGGSVTFSNAASGSAPLSYTWRKNGTPIGGGTGQ